jgi:hypothetical protein
VKALEKKASTQSIARSDSQPKIITFEELNKAPDKVKRRQKDDVQISKEQEQKE